MIYFVFHFINPKLNQRFIQYKSLTKYCDIFIYKSLNVRIVSIFLPASPKAEAGLGIAFSVRTSARPYVRPSKAVLTQCNLYLKQFSINIIETLHSVCIHIEDVHLLLWADLKIFFIYFLYAELSYFLSLYVMDGTQLV